MNIATLVPELKAALAPELKNFIGEQLATERASAQKLLDGLTTEQAGLKTVLETQIKRFDAIEALVNKPDGKGLDAEVKTIAHVLWESQQRKDYSGRARHEGGFVVSAKSLWDGWAGNIEKKTTIDSTAVGSATAGILVGERLPGIQFSGVRKIRVADLIPHIPTTNNALDFVKENAFTNAAYPQVESSAKGESALTFTISQAPVRTIAHWIPASVQILDDWAELRNAIDYKLLIGLKDAEDFELLRGDGTGQHLSGLITQATAFATSKAVSGDTKIDTLSEAMEQLEDSNREATGVVMRPGDWRQLTRIKTEEGGANKGVYLLGGPGSVATPMLWNCPVALTNAMPSGKFLVGDFVRGAVIGDRMDARIDVSNQHQDFFVKNLVAIRAEERLALAVYRSDYFVYGSFTS